MRYSILPDHHIALNLESRFPIVGDYNLSNAMVAACMAYKLGVSLADIQATISSFQPVEHRLEYIGEKDGVKFYNDSKATNTHAVTAALSSFDKNILLLAGGHDKGISFLDLKQYDDRVKCLLHCFNSFHMRRSSDLGIWQVSN